MEKRKEFDIPMQSKIIFRHLEPNEILLRVDRVEFVRDERGQSLPFAVILPYKTARTDFDILDETVGTRNWQDKYYEAKGQLFCSIGININFDHPELPAEWLWKSDTGELTNISAEKGLASDCRKRAGVCWGIGRELYTFLGKIRIPLRNDEFYKPNNKDYYVCTTKFRVSEIYYDKSGNVTASSFIDENGNLRGEYKRNPLLDQIQKAAS